MGAFSLKKYSKFSTLFIFSAFFFAFAFLSFNAMAVNPNNSPMSVALCNIIRIINGRFGRAFAAIAVIVLGGMFFIGKVSWSTALATAVAIGLVFGASQVVALVSGTANTAGSNSCGASTTSQSDVSVGTDA